MTPAVVALDDDRQTAAIRAAVAAMNGSTSAIGAGRAIRYP